MNTVNEKTILSQALRDREFLAKRYVYWANFEDDSPPECLINCAIELSKTDFGVLAYVPVSQDTEVADYGSTTSVERISLVNGVSGYFKSYRKNLSGDLYSFFAYGFHPLATMINEVLAYRLSQVMGSVFSRLVPETVIKVIGDDFGSFQEEVMGYTGVDFTFISLDSLRAAAIFDFITCNLDRNFSNVLYVQTNNGYEVRLIDNAYSFPGVDSKGLNVSVFTESQFLHKLGDCDLSFAECEAVLAAIDTLREWGDIGLMEPVLVEQAVFRCELLLRHGLLSVGDYLAGKF